MTSRIAEVRGKILKSSKLYGFSLNSDSVKYLVKVLADLLPAELEDAVEQLWSHLAKQKTATGFITQQQCEQAVLEVTGQGEDGNVKLLDVIGAFHVPRYLYNTEQQKFIKEAAHLFPDDSDGLTNHFRYRYLAIYQRLFRNPLFSKKSAASATPDATKFKIKSLEALYGCSDFLENITVFGLITQAKANVWQLEDLNGCVELDLSQAEFRPGLICDNTFVLCEGNYESEKFHVKGISLPPPEETSITRAQFGDLNFFGGDLTTCAAANETLKLKEHENQDSFLVFLSHVTLDDEAVMRRLHVLFSGYQESPPVAFIICGPFLKAACIHADPSALLSERFRVLGRMIVSMPEFKEHKTQFVFVPAMSDVGSLQVYPRHSLPPSVTSAFSKLVETATFTTNPCRIQYCTREIVVFREDLISKMCRCRVNDLREDLPMHFARTLVSTASLNLLPISSMPTYWSYDQAMSLYPLPNLVVAADSYFPYTEQCAGCTVINPSSFPGTNFSFKVYYPASNEIEDSEITEEMDFFS